FFVNIFLYSLLTHFITKYLYFCLSLYDILDFFLFNLISELFTLGLGLKYSLGTILNIEISTSAIKSNANERFVFNNLLANPYSTIKYISSAILSKTTLRILSVLIMYVILQNILYDYILINFKCNLSIFI